MDAAFGLFTEQGIDSTTTRQIAQAADVNEVTLFRHFGSKDGIARAVVEHSFPEETLPVLKQLAPSDDLAEDLKALTRTIVDIHDQRRDFFRFVFANVVQHPEHREFFNNMQQPLLAWLTDFLAPRCQGTDLQPNVVALEFIGPIVMRSIRRYFLGQVLIDDETFIHHHATIIARALQASGGKEATS